MKNIFRRLSIVSLLSVVCVTLASGQNPPSTLQSNPWNNTQLMQPGILAKMISSKQKVHIYNIGVVQNIKGAVNMGAASEKENLAKFNNILKTLPKDETIVVYCGCCPMDKCPNIRPAFRLLKDQKFSRAFLLNIPVNLKTDWISKGYPLDSSAK